MTHHSEAVKYFDIVIVVDDKTYKLHVQLKIEFNQDMGDIHIISGVMAP